MVQKYRDTLYLHEAYIMQLKPPAVPRLLVLNLTSTKPDMSVMGSIVPVPQNLNNRINMF